MNFRDIESLSAGSSVPTAAVLDAIPFDEAGLVAAVAQQCDTGEVLMLAWMNRLALERTLATGRAYYWSRSRAALWCKGDTSGCTQTVKEVRLDCDGDALLILVDQVGGACHTGRRSCFYHRLDQDQLTVLNSPQSMKEVS